MRMLLSVMCLMASLAAQAAGDPKLGKSLHDKQCAACHVKLLGGDGSGMYTLAFTAVLLDGILQELFQAANRGQVATDAWIAGGNPCP